MKGWIKPKTLTDSALWTARQFVTEADVLMTLSNNCVTLDSSASHLQPEPHIVADRNDNVVSVPENNVHHICRWFCIFVGDSRVSLIWYHNGNPVLRGSGVSSLSRINTLLQCSKTPFVKADFSKSNWYLHCVESFLGFYPSLSNEGFPLWILHGNAVLNLTWARRWWLQESHSLHKSPLNQSGRPRAHASLFWRRSAPFPDNYAQVITVRVCSASFVCKKVRLHHMSRP